MYHPLPLPPWNATEWNMCLDSRPLKGPQNKIFFLFERYHLPEHHTHKLKILFKPPFSSKQAAVSYYGSKKQATGLL